jgi:2-polyprenyl-3-methyl-5-hydroxy-6-metoxy-1,4-benzoquinol methylase
VEHSHPSATSQVPHGTNLQCPLCRNPTTQPYLHHVVDHFHSEKTFDLYHCDQCATLSTKPIPSNLEDYYPTSTYISHNNPRKNIFQQLYHLVQNANHRWKLRLIRPHIHGNQYADYGAGNGSFAKYLIQKKVHVDAFDLYPDHVAVTETSFPIQPLEAFDSNDKQYHCITLWHALEHTNDPIQVVTKLTQKLRPDGILVLGLPNYQSADAKIYGLYWAAYDVPRHIHHFSPTSIAYIAKTCGLTLVQSTAMPFDVFYISFLSEKYRKGSISIGIMHALRCSFHTLFETNKASSITYILRKSL